jgi:hypothetical protein
VAKTKQTPPTLAQFGAYQAAWEYFNKELFGGLLKPCLLNFRGKHKWNMGLFWPHKWQCSGETTHEIALNPEVLHRPLKATFSTLVHEMIHQWQEDHGDPPRSGYHDKKWAAKMEEVGLIPSDTGEPGGKKTGQRMTHYIDPQGAFRRAFDRMPKEIYLPWMSGGRDDEAKKPAGKNKTKTKYTCGCGTPVWGKAGLKITCEECGEEFQQEEGGEEP